MITKQRFNVYLLNNSKALYCRLMKNIESVNTANHDELSKCCLTVCDNVLIKFVLYSIDSTMIWVNSTYFLSLTYLTDFYLMVVFLLLYALSRFLIV